MIKGAQKQMIVVRTGHSHYFDEAYFVLRREMRAPHCKRDMLREANRILEEAALPHPDPKNVRRFRLLPFLIGLLCGAAVCLLLCLLLL